MYSYTLSLASALDGDGWLTPRPGRFTSGPYCTRGWVGPTAGLGGCGKSHPPPGFVPRTVQSVANRYTVCAIPAHTVNYERSPNIFQIVNTYWTVMGLTLNAVWELLDKIRDSVCGVDLFSSRQTSSLWYQRKLFLRHCCLFLPSPDTVLCDWYFNLVSIETDDSPKIGVLLMLIM